MSDLDIPAPRPIVGQYWAKLGGDLLEITHVGKEHVIVTRHPSGKEMACLLSYLLEHYKPLTSKELSNANRNKDSGRD